jgi:hypothetical protein
VRCPACSRAPTPRGCRSTRSWWRPGSAYWAGGNVVIGALGSYGDGSRGVLPEWWDILVVIAFSLIIFRWAVSLGLTRTQVGQEVAKDAHQLAGIAEA